jgi:uncharacterized OB-fold protein
MSATSRPLPLVTEDSAPYWASTREHATRIQRCTRCGEHTFYPSRACHACGSLDTEWVPVSGAGTVHSYTVVHRAGVGDFAARMPFTVVLVTLDEGPTMMANLLDDAGNDVTENVTIGMRVRMAYETVTDEITLPVFVPLPDA